MTRSSDTTTYWNRANLDEALLGAIAASGLDLSTATPDDLAPLDQFHAGGKRITRELATLAEVRSGMQVLDVGGGLGGPARMLAVEYGAHVTVCDLTSDFLIAGARVTEGMGLAGQVCFCQGNALRLPFAAESFDLVWTQNSGMQIADKTRLYQSLRRVLRPSGRLAQVEPVAASIEPPYFPTMWAREPAESHVFSADVLHQIIVATGWVERHWNPNSSIPAATAGPVQTATTIQHLVMGDRLPAIREAGDRNRAEKRLQTLLAVFDRGNPPPG